jgi:hypothetical protein
MPHPTDLKALGLIADRAPGRVGVLVADAVDAGVGDAALRNLQLEGMIVVVDDGGHPTIYVTESGESCLLRQPTLFGF